MNKELLEIAKKAAEAWKNTEGYTFASDLISQLCAEIESPRVWTPCAEGLPEVGKDVIIYYDANGIYNTSVGFMGRSKTWYLTDEEQSQVKVIAWRNLPEPYNPDHFVDVNKKMQEGSPKEPEWKQRAARSNYDPTKYDKED